MAKEVGTLREIGARVGDVVKWTDSDGDIIYTVCVGGIVLSESGAELRNGINYDGDKFRIIRRAAKPFNTLTAEEKGALLLANLEGKIIEMSLDGGETWQRSYTPQWIGAACYRVKSDEVELVSLAGSKFVNHWGFGTDIAPTDTHRITFNLVNGKPDCASVKMEEI